MAQRVLNSDSMKTFSGFIRELVASVLPLLSFLVFVALQSLFIYALFRFFGAI